MSFPAYENYRDSGVEWLGYVPAHWTVKAIKRLTPVCRGASPRPIEDPKYFDDDGEYGWVRIADVSASSGVLQETTQRLSALGSSFSVKLEPGSLFVSIAGTVGKPCISSIRACIHDGFVYFPRLQIAPRFLYRIFEAGNCYAGLGKLGTQLNLNTDTIGSIRIAVPPHGELDAILRFLDGETAKIDSLIAEQQRLIDLLKEKRQAMISHAVTKGINPHAPMKDSGVEWLGAVPAHWQLIKAKRLFRFVKRQDKAELPVLSVYRDYGVLLKSSRDDNNNKTPDDLSLYQTVNIGDLVINKMKAWQGSLGVSALEGITSPDYAVFAPQHAGSALFLNALFRCKLMPAVYKSISNGIRPDQWRIEPDKFLQLDFVLPPVSEQNEIAAHLEREIAAFETLSTASERAITLLQERRSALISAAVTGKIDVRGLVSVEAEAA